MKIILSLTLKDWSWRGKMEKVKVSGENNGMNDPPEAVSPWGPRSIMMPSQ